MDAQIKVITSAANPAIKMLRSLDTKKYREEEGLFLVEGMRHIEDALRGGWQIGVLAFSARAKGDPQMTKAINACLSAQGQCLEVTDELLGKITNRDNAQPVIAALRQRWTTLDEIAAEKDALWVGLEAVRDPGNLGTIIRTCDAVQAQGIILIGNCCDPWSPETIHATMGSFARVKIARAQGSDFLRWRAGWKGRVLGTHLHKESVDYRGAAYETPLILLMGGEQSGLSAEMAAACDGLVKIPMAGETESLNLSVSTGIMLYEICRKRL